MKLNFVVLCCLAALVSCRIVKRDADVEKKYRKKLAELKSDVVEEIAESQGRIDGTKSLIPEEFVEAYTTFKTNVKNLFASEAEYDNKIKVLDSKYGLFESAIEKFRPELIPHLEKAQPLNEEFLKYVDGLLVDPVKELGDDYEKGYDKIKQNLEEFYSKYRQFGDKIQVLRDGAVDLMEKFKNEDLKHFSNEMEKEKIDLEQYKSIENKFVEIFLVYPLL